MKSVYQKWREWAKANGVQGTRYARLYARLARSPAANRVWAARY
jgi:hypothetical protein